MKKKISICAVLLFAAMLLCRPDAAAQAVRDGLSLCFRTVVPSLFPFLAVSGLLLRLGFGAALQPVCAVFMGPMFRMRGICAAPLVTGLLGGYPTGAKAAAELYEQGAVTRQEAELLLGFCNNCGPGFLLGFVGAGILGSAQAGAYLFLVHALAALLTGIVLTRRCRRRDPPALPCHLPAQRISLPRMITESVSAALTSMLGICAYVVLFRTVAAVLPTSFDGGILGIVEMVSGAASLPANAAGFVAAAAITAWGGVSVHCQTMSVVGELSLKYHTVGKLLQTVFSVLLALAVARWVYR